MLEEESALAETKHLIQAMQETMRDAPGVGLAAPQVGLGLRLAVIEDRSEYSKDIAPERLAERERQAVPFQVLINPVIVEQSEEQVEEAGRAHLAAIESDAEAKGYHLVTRKAARVHG